MTVATPKHLKAANAHYWRLYARVWRWNKKHPTNTKEVVSMEEFYKNWGKPEVEVKVEIVLPPKKVETECWCGVNIIKVPHHVCE